MNIPPIPPPRGYETSAAGELFPRYEDITQDGRFQLMTLMPGTAVLWRELTRDARFGPMREQGVLPILRRIVIVAAPAAGSFSVAAPVRVSGTWRLARETGGERIILGMWLDVHAPLGFTHGPPPAADAERVLVAQLHAEHVVTRPFAPPAERKVTRLDLPGLPPVPEDEHVILEAEELLGGRALEPAGERRFGMMHTDSNQHVNSLVYPRLFEEAVVERAAGVAGSEGLLARAIDVRYRKPFFAGDRASLALAVARGDAGVEAHGVFAPAHDAKPSCAIGMRLA